ncbi:MAG: hypothetical protein ACFFCO_01945 [Promethearchaeota archaeon]
MTKPTTDSPPILESRSHPFFTSKEEQRYIALGHEYPDFIYPAHPDAVQEGFAYLFSAGFRPPSGEDFDPDNPPMRRMGIPRRKMIGMIGIFRKIMKGMRQSWEDIEPYFGQLEPTPFEPKPGLWEELNGFIQKKWKDVRVGFTELPQQMIFKNKFTLFRYALIVSQEMKRDKIDKAPDLTAGKEVMRVYGSLGLVVNDIARWLRKQGVRCQSNHPLGGLTNTPTLAGKAGMGWQGRSGLLITPEFGPRVRLAPVFIEHPYFEFTDHRDHDWIEAYCELCQRCERECPGQAINSEKTVAIDNVPGIGALRTCIDRIRCFEFFSKTLGCSVCVKVCPFSEGGDIYERLKAVVQKRQD